jgi:hypothetical protein
MMPRMPQRWACPAGTSGVATVMQRVKSAGARKLTARPVVAYSPKSSPDSPCGARRAR